MRFIGITGGVGAGKSAILQYLSEHYNVRTLLADEIAELLMQPQQVCYPGLQEIFAGDDVFKSDGVIDRPKMAAVMFADEMKRNKVNALVHPAVKQYILEIYQQEKQQDALDYLILEAALLLEEHYDEICDELWYIYTSEANRRARLIQNRGYSNEKIDRIFASQSSEKEFRAACAEVIDNNGTTEETIAELQKVLERKGESTNGECK